MTVVWCMWALRSSTSRRCSTCTVLGAVSVTMAFRIPHDGVGWLCPLDRGRWSTTTGVRRKVESHDPACF